MFRRQSPWGGAVPLELRSAPEFPLFFIRTVTLPKTDTVVSPGRKTRKNRWTWWDRQTRGQRDGSKEGGRDGEGGEEGLKLRRLSSFETKCQFSSSTEPIYERKIRETSARLCWISNDTKAVKYLKTNTGGGGGISSGGQLFRRFTGTRSTGGKHGTAGDADPRS